MQVTLKQSEITAAIAAYLTSALGVSGVSPETLTVVYKQGRSDKNGMTAELEIDAPRYEAPKALVLSSEPKPFLVDAEDKVFIAESSVAASCAAVIANTELGAELGNASGVITDPVATTSALNAEPLEPAPVVVAAEVAPSPELVYDGERRSEERLELVDNLPEVLVEPEVEVPVVDEVAQALAEDEAADAEEAEAPVVEAKAEALFG